MSERRKCWVVFAPDGEAWGCDADPDDAWEMTSSNMAPFPGREELFRRGFRCIRMVEASDDTDE